MDILPNISRSKGNRTMKFSQLIEYNMRNIFLEKSYTKCGGDTITRPFYKSSNLSMSLDQWSKVLWAYLILFQVEEYQNTLNLRFRPLAFTSCKAFLKNKKKFGISFSTSFSAWFLKKNIYLGRFFYLIKFYALVVFLS